MLLCGWNVVWVVGRIYVDFLGCVRGFSASDPGIAEFMPGFYLSESGQTARLGDSFAPLQRFERT